MRRLCEGKFGCEKMHEGLGRVWWMQALRLRMCGGVRLAPGYLGICK